MSIFEDIYRNRINGQPFVLATIINTKGASPRLPGAKMLVFPDGKISGTIGGGKFEMMVIEDSVNLFQSEGNYLFKKYKFSKSGEGATGMVCGGEAEVFMELNLKPKKLIIFGGGHIGKELVRLAQGSGFVIIVIDDRPEILAQYKNPITAVRTNSEYSENLPELDLDSYIVIITRSHTCDHAVLNQIIKKKYAYLGIIGSRAKTALLSKQLKESGIEQNLLDQLYTPIGLNIKSEGPYEIAVSIMAELIAVKNGIIRTE